MIGNTKNYFWHLYKILYKKNVNPSYLIYYPTSRCNLKCSHCFYHDSLNSKFDELSLGEIDQMTKSMDPLLSLILTGGEPYIRKDIHEIVKIFYKNTKLPIVSIPSNGFYTKRMMPMVESIVKDCSNLTLNQQISIDGIGEDHDKIRGVKGSYDKLINTINELKIIQNEFSNLNIGIIITFTSENQNKIKNYVYEIYEKIRPDNISINLVRGDPKEKVNVNLDIKKYQDVVKLRDNLYFSKKLNSLKNFKGNKFVTAGRVILNKYVNEIYERGKYISPCYSANLSGVIYPEGDVYPCEILDKSHKIGNIRDYDLDFKKLWSSTKANNEKNFIKKTKCFCTHECFNYVNIMFNPKYIPEIISKSLKI